MSNTRSGGRSAIVRAKVLSAAEELVFARGPEKVTIPEVAQRAGVAVTSIYRRWGDVNSLLLDMAADRLSQRWPLPNEGSIERDLKSWCGRIAAGLQCQGETSFLRTLLLTWNVSPEVRTRALAPRVEQLEAMLQRGRERGEKTPSLSDVVDYLLAPLYTRSLLGFQIDEAAAHRLVDRLLLLPE